MNQQTDLQDRIAQLLSGQQSLLLATIDEHGQAYASYAPYAYDFAVGELYVFLSDLAQHSQYLRDRPKASVLIIEDEHSAEQIYARHRLQYQITAEEMTREHPAIFEQLQQRHGNVIELLQSLPDFHLFKLKPLSGRYVEGFGRAYHLAGGGFAVEPEHISPQKP